MGVDGQAQGEECREREEEGLGRTRLDERCCVVVARASGIGQRGGCPTGSYRGDVMSLPRRGW